MQLAGHHDHCCNYAGMLSPWASAPCGAHGPGFPPASPSGLGHAWFLALRLSFAVSYLLCTHMSNLSYLALKKKSPAQSEGQGLGWCLGCVVPCVRPLPVPPAGVMPREIARAEGTAAKCGCRQLIWTELLQHRQKERHHRQTELLGPQTEVSTKRGHRLPVQKHRF